MSNPRAYTALLVNERGVVLYRQHLARLARAGAQFEGPFRDFAERAVPGVYAIAADTSGFEIRTRAASTLVDGISTRFLVSPYATEPGPFEKPLPPSRYNSARVPGVATLLTSLDGGEIFESCTASAISWDGNHLFAPPPDRPTTRSTALAALEEAGLVTFAPVLVSSRMPLALVNAVAGIKLPALAEREPFPAEIRKEIEELFAMSAERSSAISR